jgi:hypothetical protein
VQVTYASEPGEDPGENEDWVAATPDHVVLLAGCGTPPDLDHVDSGCEHSVAWYARQLGARLVAGLASDDTVPLAEALRSAIAGLAAEHGATCDVAHPGAPAATVALLRAGPDVVDYLVLSDSVLLLDDGERVRPVSDGRATRFAPQVRAALRAVPAGTPEHRALVRDLIVAMRHHRNIDGGFWLAAGEPAAADAAVTGSVPRPELRRVAMLTDGASRLADMFGQYDWPALLDLLGREGPEALIARTREAERSDPECRRWPRTRPRDDATAVLCVF